MKCQPVRACFDAFNDAHKNAGGCDTRVQRLKETALKVSNGPLFPDEEKHKLKRTGMTFLSEVEVFEE